MYSTVQYSTVQCSAVHVSTAQYTYTVTPPYIKLRETKFLTVA